MNDPITEDYGQQELYAEEVDREQRWTEFVTSQRRRCLDLYKGDWGMVLCDVIGAMDFRHIAKELSPTYEPFVSFAETEGWHGVLRAIGQAMRENDK